MEGIYTLKDGRKVYIREAFVEDAELLHEFFKKVTGETEFLITKPEEVFDVPSEKQLIRIYRSQYNRLYLVAFHNDEVVGVLKIAGNRRKRVQHVGELSIAILKSFQGVGLGSLLMEKGIDWSKKHGILRIELEVLENNERAIRLYEKFGFEVEGKKKRYAKLSKGFVDILIMAKIF